MLASWPVAMIIGTILGFLAGLGTGGGSLLILWLTVVLGMDALTARTINLLFFLPAALISTLFRWKQGKIDPKKLLPGILAGCICAGVFAFISMNLELGILKKLFGGMLLATGCKEMFYK